MIPQSKARSLLEDCGVTALPIDPFELCKTLNIVVHEDDFGSTCEGTLIVNQSKALIGINSSIKSRHRKIYTCSHELGHFCMDVGIDGQATFKCDSISINSYSKSIEEIEVRANQFASELLMPKHLVKNEIIDRELAWESIKELSDISDVSLTAAARKFMEHTDEACALVVSRGNKISWFHSSTDFHLRINMDSRIVSRDSHVSKIFSDDIDDRSDFEDVDALAWVHGGLAKPGDKIMESSLPMNSYGEVLTLLWDDQGVAEANMEEEDSEQIEENFDPRYGWETPTFQKSKRKK